LLLTLLFSLSGPAIGAKSDFGRSLIAAKAIDSAAVRFSQSSIMTWGQTNNYGGRSPEGHGYAFLTMALLFHLLNGMSFFG
jgi:hypothetical protein